MINPSPYTHTHTHKHTIWASLVAQIVNNLPAMQEIQVHSLGQKKTLEKGQAPHSSIFGLENSMDRGALWTTAHRVAKSQTSLND